MSNFDTGLFLGFAFLGVLITAGLTLRYAVGKRGKPCPASFSWILYNPYTRLFAGADLVIERAGIEQGMKVLDAGCGPGRLTIPAARAVGADGTVVALDVQSKMLAKVAAKTDSERLANVVTLEGGLGDGSLVGYTDEFDRALLVTVLGEVPGRAAALAEIHRSLKPGGVLSVTEMILDPDYLTRRTVMGLAESAGFRLDRAFGTWLAFTMNFVKLTDEDGAET
ncbi:MAG: methyltransferase domain-containing protein [Candidatus Coatesbacteria bacterium]|nr:MAG: methyltransferase domain-containing protein [Candidatus Coatesbacteria bacterium]